MSRSRSHERNTRYTTPMFQPSTQRPTHTSLNTLSHVSRRERIESAQNYGLAPRGWRRTASASAHIGHVGKRAAMASAGYPPQATACDGSHRPTSKYHLLLEEGARPSNILGRGGRGSRAHQLEILAARAHGTGAVQVSRRHTCGQLGADIP